MAKEVRVRFAPSPTGALHVGGVRTALYNYLFARKNGGKFILRIEDTDQSRFVEGAEEYIFESLDWAGLHPDEGPNSGGPYGPYRQSERKSFYKKYAQQLIDNGHAYYAFDTTEELDAMRERLKAAKVETLHYNSITRMQMKNSLTLTEEEVNEKLSSGEPYVIRLKVPRKEDVRLNDMIRGWVMVHSSAIDDKVLMKSDGMPTYHLANVVDDYLMKISHVIRGEEWLPSAPLHVLLYKYLGWEDSMPQFAHLPLLLKPDGNGKLSKRDGDKLGFPVFPITGQFPDKEGKLEPYSGFREAGYLPDAFINFLAFLGWNPGTEQELFSMNELVDAFSIDRIGKSGAKFDIEKAKWYNQQYIKAKPASELVNYMSDKIEAHHIQYSHSSLEKICDVLKERVEFPEELWNEAQIFFVKPVSYDEKVTSKKWNQTVVEVLTEYKSILLDSVDLDSENAKTLLNEVLERQGVKMGMVMQSLRVALTGQGSGPDLMQVIEILGARESSDRITAAIENIQIDA
ncbi:MAG: glutamate--tRNA ligase [Fulvivirga sp.]|uniref:glutamate--tRNA ligase n=1 Tax=Fulvivirga sp. TaxID=1931237 RepID=UPI0032F091D4